MPTIIDSFLVEFGLDPKPLAKGSAEVRSQLKKTKEEAFAAGRDIDAYGKRASTFFSKLRNEVAGLFLAFAGASTVKSFITDIIAGDAATGRLAANLGVATSELSAWQLAAQSAGGATADADAAFRTLVKGFQSYRLTGSTGFNDDLKGLGVTLDDLATPATALLKMAEAGERMDRAQFFTRLQNIGIPDSVITVLAKGRAETERLVEAKTREAAITARNAEASQRFEAALNELQTRMKDGVRPALTTALEGLVGFLETTDGINVVLPVAIGLFGALAVAAVAATWPFIALAAAIGGVAWAYMELTRAKKSGGGDGNPNGWWNTFKRVLSGGPATVPVTAQGTEARAGESDRATFFRKSGYTEAQTRGILAGIHAESGGNPNALNPTSGAFGLGQWLGPRKRELFKRYGRNPTEAQQLEFMDYELRGGDAGGKYVMGAKTDTAALEAYIKRFMRPAAGAETEGDLRRGMAYLGARPGVSVAGGRSMSSSTTTTIGQITVYTPGTDAAGIARDLPAAIARRGLTAQAATGLD
jgi:hypothetical protein